MTIVDRERRFFVYTLWREGDPEPFYVGKGTGRRHHHHRRAKSQVGAFIRQTKSEGVTVVERIDFDNLEERAALTIETALIKMYGKALLNVVDNPSDRSMRFVWPVYPSDDPMADITEFFRFLHDRLREGHTGKRAQDLVPDELRYRYLKAVLIQTECPNAEAEAILEDSFTIDKSGKITFHATEAKAIARALRKAPGPTR